MALLFLPAKRCPLVQPPLLCSGPLFVDLALFSDAASGVIRLLSCPMLPHTFTLGAEPIVGCSVFLRLGIILGILQMLLDAFRAVPAPLALELMMTVVITAATAAKFLGTSIILSCVHKLHAHVGLKS
eukprot:6468080-Amphidinium_carterae.2